MSTGPTARTKLPSAAGRAASLGTPTGTQPATSPSAVVRAGLPPTSRTRTGDLSPELQAVEQLAHPLCSNCRELEERLAAQAPPPAHRGRVAPARPGPPLPRRGRARRLPGR